MALLEIPKAIGKNNPFYKGNEDPFFTVLGILKARDSDNLNAVFSSSNPWQIAVLPPLLLHPSVDLSYIANFAIICDRMREVGTLAQKAIAFAERDTPPDPHFTAVFEEFKKRYQRIKATLERMAVAGDHSFEDMTDNEFVHAYSTYRHFVYNGSEAFPFSKRA